MAEVTRSGSIEDWLNLGFSFNLDYFVRFHNGTQTLLREKSDLPEVQQDPDLQDAIKRYDKLNSANALLLMLSFLEEMVIVLWRHRFDEPPPQEGTLERSKRLLRAQGVDPATLTCLSTLRDAYELRHCLLHANGRVSFMANQRRIRKCLSRYEGELEHEIDRVVVTSHFLPRCLAAIRELQDALLGRPPDPKRRAKQAAPKRRKAPSSAKPADDSRASEVRDSARALRPVTLRPDAKVVFFLGAGASQDAGGPLISNFVDAIRRAIDVGKVPRPAAEALSALRERASHEPGVDPDNIEDLLRLAHQDGEQAPLRQVSEAVCATLEACIRFSYRRRRLASRDPSYRRLAEALERIEKQGRTAGVVTVNYDVCADVAISDAGRRSYYCLNEKRSASGHEIPLAKLHGSLNWIGCFNCGYVNAKHHVQELPTSEHAGAWTESEEQCVTFPREVEPCPHCGEQAESPLIVPPVADKRPFRDQTMRVVWKGARAVLDGADLVVVAGYSCAPADALVNELFDEATGHVLVANPDPRAYERIREHAPRATLMKPVPNLSAALSVVGIML